MSISIQITEQLENKFVAQENGLIITNVDSVAEFRAVIEDEKSSISKELKELNENNETVEFDIHQVGKKTVRLNISTISQTGVKGHCFELEDKLRKKMKDKYNSILKDFTKKRGKSFFIKANKSFIQRKKGQITYKLVEKIRKEEGECKIGWKNGQIQLNGESVRFFRTPKAIFGTVGWDDVQYDEYVLL